MKEKKCFWGNGNLKSILVTDDQNRSHGKQLGWHENGNLWWEENYLHGRKHGKFIVCLEEGGIYTDCAYYVNDSEVSVDEYYALVDEKGIDDIDRVRLDELLAKESFEGIARRQFISFVFKYREEMTEILRCSIHAKLECPWCTGEFGVTLEKNDV
jgi:antitoxin component YwqK of YwqJK toxin-antitoxin module